MSAQFPEARVERLDRDVAAGVKSEKVLERMRRGEIDILVGTQMVTKGHDLPEVTLVGVLDADAALSLPDFRASERTFHLLVQVAGSELLARVARERRLPHVEVVAPSPAPIARVRNRYRYRFLVKSPDRKALRQTLLAVLRAPLDRRVHLVVDVDPMSML